ncbi:TetR/AcrR family transcriptional regulator [Corynebacterium uropygiale]|uniref:TetR/AcrR family transcriptional regulator n=1 Tax=Corynebacterium uropygiale TaxID=1775911 RepID=A0A9X1QQF9_9CORY|nr:TetR/AcrR family transcriptional regulator [Corynebacterium uropygiale]MCF4006542.1 TetR/AcrR family transcriptional regulator [Corynebacterium uropygiale]
MRADALRRREALIEAACELVRTRHEDSIPLEAIAQRAGVGIATLYRNFPDRISLRHACAAHLFNEAVALLEEARDAMASAPATVVEEAWTDLMWSLVRLGLGAIVPVFVPTDVHELPEDLQAITARVLELLNEVASDAQRAGLLDPEIDGLTVLVGLFTASRPQVEGLNALVPDLEATMVKIYLRGLQPRTPQNPSVEASTPSAHCA